MFHPGIEHHNLLKRSNETSILRAYDDASCRILCKTIVEGVRSKQQHTTETVQHTKFAMEAIGHSFSLTLDNGGVDIIREALGIYSSWLRSCPSSMKSCEQQFICDIVGHFSLLFVNPDSQQFIDHHEKLCIRVIQTLQQLFEKRGGFLTPHSWDYIIRLVLGTADNLLSEAVRDEDLGSRIAIPLTRLVIEMYLRYLSFTEPDTTLWDLFDKFLRRWAHRMTTIIQWNALCLCLTHRVMLDIERKPTMSHAELANVAITWTVEEPPLRITMHDRLLKFAWYRCLHLLGNPNRLRFVEGGRFVESNVHSTAIQGVCVLTDLLLGAGLGANSLPPLPLPLEHLPFNVSTDANTILQLLGGWLFDAAMNIQPEFSEGRAKAIGALCRIFCSPYRNGRNKTMFVAHRTRYELTLKIALDPATNDHRSIAAVIYSGRRVLGCNIAGARNLIPFLNKAIDRVLGIQVPVPVQGNKSTPTLKGRKIGSTHMAPVEITKFGNIPVASLRTACAEILSTEVCLGRHFLRLPEAEPNGKSNAQVAAVSKPLMGLSQQLKELVMRALRTETADKTLQMLLWTCHVLCLQDPGRCSEIIPYICQQLLSDDPAWVPEVKLVALKVLGDMADIAEAVKLATNTRGVINIMNTLCTFITMGLDSVTTITPSASKHDKKDQSGEGRMSTEFAMLLLQHSYTSLFRWVAQCPWVLHPKDSWKQMATSVQYVAVRGGADAPAALANGVQVVARQLFEFCLLHAGRFPTRAGCEGFSSLLTEEAALVAFAASGEGDHFLQFYMLDNNIILSVLEFVAPGKEESQSLTLIMRDANGKYAWVTSPVTTLNDRDATIERCEAPPNAVLPHIPPTQGDVSDPLIRAVRSLGTDMMSWASQPGPEVGAKHCPQEFVIRPGEQNSGDCGHAESKESDQSTRPASGSVSGGPPSWMEMFERALDSQCTEEAKSTILGAHEHAIACTPQVHTLVTAEDAHFTKTRRLLTQLGWVSLERWNALQPIANNDLFRAKLAALDDTAEREQYEVWVMYARNKLDEDGALRTELLTGSDCNPSAEYEDFLKSVGWLVDIATHPGFLADADPALMEGNLLYFSDAHEEVVFHVPTLPLQTRGSSWAEQGNRGSVYSARGSLDRDRTYMAPVVVVLWNECEQQVYPTSPVWSDYGLGKAHLFIIIDPLGAGLYRIRLSYTSSVCYRANRADHCEHLPGPLLDGMVVSRDVLGALVRQTALNACRDTLEYRRRFQAARSFDPPQQKRQRVIDRIREEHTVQSSPAASMSQLFNTPLPVQEA